jgi:single-strand DNA-binding protein
LGKENRIKSNLRRKTMHQQIMIIGRLGADPELRYTPAGVPVCSFNVATDRTWNNDQGVKQEETTWHKVTAWRKLAEICGQYLSKGSLVAVTGNVKAQGYTNRNGEVAASLNVTADQVKFLSGKSANGEVASTPAPVQEVAAEEIPF